MENKHEFVDPSNLVANKATTWLRVYTLGTFHLEWVDPQTGQGQPLPPERLQKRGSAPALALLKALLSRPDRFATRDWLLEQFWPDSTSRSASDRLDDVASALRGLLRPDGNQEKILHFVYGADGRGSGYRLDGYTHIWCDADALSWHVEHALLLERLGQNAASLWERAYALGSRGAYLPDHSYDDWARSRRDRLEGEYRQGVLHFTDLLWKAGQIEESILRLRAYWLDHPIDEDALRPLLKMLGEQERYQEAEANYAKLLAVLTEDEREVDARTQTMIEYVRALQIGHVPGPEYPFQRDETSREEGPVILPLLSKKSAWQPTSEPDTTNDSGSQLWHVPYPRNPFFMGREGVILALYEGFHRPIKPGSVTQLALYGLGGIGKTQTALEYAYHYRSEYQTVFWITADTRENIQADFLLFASLLGLPEQAAGNDAVTIAAVKHWLQEHSNWLLILDNADEPDQIIPFLPQAISGHVLFTTRTTALRRLGIANPIVIETFSPELGALFLLRRGGLLLPDATLDQALPQDQTAAFQIVQELGGLPLALDQAGAYLEATGTSLESYQRIYQQHRVDLLRERRGQEHNHPEPVATTWLLSFQKVEERDVAATDLLHLCAFLAPDAISEEFLEHGGNLLGPHLSPIAADRYLLEKALEALRTYSLVARDAQRKTLTVHRLVQNVVRDNMPSEEQSEWMRRVVNLLHEVFPFALEVAIWPACEQLLPHALLCAHWIEQANLTSPAAASLLDKIGYYLNMRARYEEALPLFQRALAMREHILGPEHADTAQTLSNLAYLYHHQDQYEEAMSFLQRSLAMRQNVLGMAHPDTATSLNALGLLYRDQGHYEQAESFYQQALTIREQVLGPDDPQTAHSLSNLAWLYRNQGKHNEAEALYERSLAIRKRVLGLDHPDTATSLHGLALLYAAQKAYTKAEPLYRQALVIRKRVLGVKHLHTAQSMNALALLYRDQGEYEKAESLFQEALAIREQILGCDHPRTVISRNNLALLYRDQGEFEKATPLFQRVCAIREQRLGQEHPLTRAGLNNLMLCQSKMDNVP